MPVKPIVETIVADGQSDLGASLAFSLDNTGAVDAWLSFDESGAAAPLPAGTTRQFAYYGDRYVGKLHVRFAEAPANAVRTIVMIKKTFFC